MAVNVGKWDGNSWTGVGSWVTISPSSGGYVVVLAASGTNVYAGGVFTKAGGIPANNIAKWDGTSWSALGSGMNGEVEALAVSGNDLYAGGKFFKADGSLAN